MINKYNKEAKFDFACILTTGRTGSDFLQGCLDGMTGVITFSGEIPFYAFLKDKKTKEFFQEKNSKKLIKHFVKKHPNLFFKDKLENKVINLNIKKFYRIFDELSNEIDFNRKNFFINIYLSYHLTLNRKIFKKNIIVHHSHSVEETEYFCKDFDKTKVLVTLRHPFQNLKSGIINWIKYDIRKNNFHHFYLYVRRIREDLIFALKKKSFFVKLEEMHLKKTKKKICKFLNINYTSKIHTATFANKPWKSDKLSSFNSKNGIFNKNVLRENWKSFFSKNDEIILSYLYRDYVKFNYNIKKTSYSDKFLIIILMFLPLNYERKNLISILFSNSIFLIPKNIYYYFRRIAYYLRVYLVN